MCQQQITSAYRAMVSAPPPNMAVRWRECIRSIDNPVWLRPWLEEFIPHLKQGTVLRWQPPVQCQAFPWADELGNSSWPERERKRKRYKMIWWRLYMGMKIIHNIIWWKSDDITSKAKSPAFNTCMFVCMCMCTQTRNSYIVGYPFVLSIVRILPQSWFYPHKAYGMT